MRFRRTARGEFNQSISMKGGARPGAGRKKGSTDRPKLIEYWNREEVIAYFDYLKENYKKDARLAVYVGDHLMGKAPQALTGPDGGSLVIRFDNALASTPEGNR